MKAILCRIGWMDTYSGEGRIYFGRTNTNYWWENEDPLDRICGEYWNFLPGEDGIIRGFVMLTAKNTNEEYTGTININRLGANRKDEYIEDIVIGFRFVLA